MLMKQIKFLSMALVAVLMTACIGFKTEATVDVTVMKDGQVQKGVQVYRFNNDMGVETTMYKTNAKDIQTTNNKGVAHFDLKSPDDLDPSEVGIVDTETFHFATFDNDDHRNSLVSVKVSTGDKATATLVIEDVKDGDE
jgi:hypothetical protein